MKFRNNRSFLITMLCLCWPIGLLLLLKADQKIFHKIIISIGSLLIFIALLSTAMLTFHKEPSADTFEIIATRKELSVGESGGFCISTNDHYIADYAITCSDSEVLSVKNNLYTALKSGVCTITVHYKNTSKSIQIQVNTNTATNKTVYASPTGQRYHSSITHGGKSAIPFSEEEALQSGKTPCKICWKE